MYKYVDGIYLSLFIIDICNNICKKLFCRSLFKCLINSIHVLLCQCSLCHGILLVAMCIRIYINYYYDVILIIGIQL